MSASFVDQQSGLRITPWVRVLLLAVMALYAGCAQWLQPQTVVISEAELNQRLAVRFPLDRRLLEVLEVHVEAPLLHLLPDEDRLTLDLSLHVRDRLSAQTYEARMNLAAALRLQAQDQTVRLRDVRVTAWRVDKPGSSANATMQRVGGLIGEMALEGAVIYAFKPEQLERLARAGFQPGRLQIGPGGLMLQVEPIPR